MEEKEAVLRERGKELLHTVEAVGSKGAIGVEDRGSSE